jgi:hypothetical protein
MSLYAGDLTTPQRVAVWLANPPALPSPILSQLITSMTALIYSKLNRGRLYSQTITRTFDGVGNYQLVLPDYPVTSVGSVQMGAALIKPYSLPSPTPGIIPQNTFGYGWRLVPWDGNLPGSALVLEFVNGNWWVGVQNIQVTYTAGYLVTGENQTVPVSPGPYVVTVNQLQGIWSRDGGVIYAASGQALVAVTGTPGLGQYNVPIDASPGLYTFSSADAGQNLQISYSFVPADLEEACIQMVAERYSYRSRIGEISKSLGGQETIRFLRGGQGNSALAGLPPEVAMLVWPYVSVLPPTIGAPL